MKNLIIKLFTILPMSLHGQGLTESSMVSFVYCEPIQTSLATSFGHCALHFYDSALSLNKVYHYGTLDLREISLYSFLYHEIPTKFLETEYKTFKLNYQYNNRSIYEFPLVMNLKQRQKLISKLKYSVNVPSKYDYYRSNCSTRINEIIDSVLREDLIFTDTTTFSTRNFLLYYLREEPTFQVLIDLLIGVNGELDQINPNCFLPYVLYQKLRSTHIIDNGEVKQLVKSETQLTIDRDKPRHINGTSQLIILISLLLFLASLVDFFRKKITRWVDYLLLFSTSLFGILILIIWILLKQDLGAWNFNLIWLIPTNCLFLFMSNNQRKIYLSWILLLQIILICTYSIIPQKINPLFLFLASGTMSRYIVNLLL